MFERFSEQARHVVVQAQQEASRLGNDFIGTEHLLLAAIDDPDSTAVRVLRRLDIDIEVLRSHVRAGAQPSPAGSAPGQIPFTGGAKKVLELSLRQSLDLGDDRIGAEHMLLALASEPTGLGGQVLRADGLTAEKLRSALFAERAERSAEEQEPMPGRRAGLAGSGLRVVLAELRQVSSQLAAIEARLAAIEVRLAPPAD